MSNYDTTATVSQDATMNRASQNNSRATYTRIVFRNGGIVGNDFASTHPIFAFHVPTKPIGADSIVSVNLVLTGKQTEYTSPAHADSTRAYSNGDLPWTETFISYNSYASFSLWPRDVSHGSTINSILGVLQLPAPNNTIYGSSFSWAITDLGLDWGKNGQCNLSFATYNTLGQATFSFFGINGTVGTTAWYPHIVVRFEDNPPLAIADLTASPDVSLSEASYTFRQRVLLKWTASDANDFSRYRIRFGVNRSSSANHTHKAFVSSRASNSYLDTTLYTDGSTIYYSVYVEDTRNQSASTNTNVSNVVSWTKPDAVVGSVSIGSSASTLQEIEARVRTTTMANGKKVKVVWGDNAYTFSENLTSAGGYFYARHRYTKATSGYTIRAQVEDINGFRSALDSYGTSVTIANLGPVAKIVASPSRQRTGSTFSAGNRTDNDTVDIGSSRIALSLDSNSDIMSDGIGLSFRIRTGTTTGSYALLLLSKEGARYKIKNVKEITTASASTEIRRDINWHLSKSDILAIQIPAVVTLRNDQAKNRWGINGVSYSSTVFRTIGATFDRYRLLFGGGAGPAIRLTYALTNPVHFSAKDSFARGSNKFINRFRWDTDYNGTFGSNFETGATTSFYYAWTTATTQFVAVRAVDNSHSSSIDIAGVVVETESTFRFPNDLRDGVNSQIRDARSRAYTHSYALSKDGGSLDLGSLGPRSLMISGTAYSKSTSASTYIDIERISGVFQQRKRCYVQLPGKSTSSALQGYVVDVPNVYSTDDPDAAGWDLTVVVAS